MLREHITTMMEKMLLHVCKVIYVEASVQHI
jgi:hypothetical protein